MLRQGVVLVPLVGNLGGYLRRTLRLSSRWSRATCGPEAGFPLLRGIPQEMHCWCALCGAGSGHRLNRWWRCGRAGRGWTGHRRYVAADATQGRAWMGQVEGRLESRERKPQLKRRLREFHSDFRGIFADLGSGLVVTRSKQEYLHRQHNMLCFILDTPHRGRYFHDCVTERVKRKYRASPVEHASHGHLRHEPARRPSAREVQADPLKAQVHEC